MAVGGIISSEVKPVSPNDIKVSLPDFVINAVNSLISNRYRGGSFSIKREEIVKKIIETCPRALEREEIFEKQWLDFENLYRQAGWKVNYVTPERGESFDEYFNFEPR